jgi:hypothetical protein
MASNIEMQALNLVNEEILGPEVKDIDKYNHLLSSRKNRKAVSYFQQIFFRAKIFSIFSKGRSRTKWERPWANHFKMFPMSFSKRSTQSMSKTYRNTGFQGEPGKLQRPSCTTTWRSVS